MDVLVNWLADAGIQSNSLEQDFASGYLFARLLQAHSLQPDLQAFQNKGKPDAYLNNYMRLQPTLNKLGVKLDTRTAQALINKEPGLAAKVLLSIKQQLDGLSTNLQAVSQASKKLQQCTVRTSPSRGLLEAQQHKSQYAALDASNSKFFEDVMRKNSASPNMLMESLHLKHFANEGSRQAAAAAEAAAAAAAADAAGRSAFREGLKTKMAVSRTDKAVELERDEAVHAAILRHQDDVERQELRVEMALAEIGAQRQQDQRRTAAADAAAGIDAFEMTLKRLGAAGGSGTADPIGPVAGESPMATLGRIRSFAPTAAKLADSKGEYLSVIKARRQEEAATRKEREGRRRRMLVEQQAARSAAEGRVEADCLLEVLVRRSAEEQKLAQHLWQLQQEKAAMEAGRKLREEQYAALKDKEWEDTLRREAALHRSLHSQHTSAVQQELATWREHQDAAALAAEAEKAGLARETAWQLVQLAERVVEFRAATGGQAVPLADWRAWVSLFLAGDPALGSPIIATDPAALQEPPSAQGVLNTAELQDYLACQGAWALDTATAQAAAAASTGAIGGSASSPPTPAVVPAAAVSVAPHANKSLWEVVAELAQLAQKLRPKMAAAQQQSQQQQQESQLLEEGTIGGSAEGLEAPESPAPVVTAAEAAAGSGAASGADVIHSMPLKLAVVGSPFSGKSTVAHTLAQAFGLRLLSPQQLVTDAIAAARAWERQGQPDPTAPAAHAAPGAEQAVDAAPSPLVSLGLQADVDILAGRAVSDELMVQLLLLAMQQAKVFVPADKLPEPTTETPTKGTKAATLKAATKSEGGAAGARHGTSSGGAAPATSPTLGVAAALAAGLGSAGSGLALPANLAAGITGRGFVIDGFPASEAQAQLLEKALTGLDLAAEQELLREASVISPAPAAKLPQLQRPLLSGLDAVLLLDCADEALALQRVLGRRLDPVTGQLYHLDFDPPPANNPGMIERLVQPPGQEEEAGRVPERLASWASSSAELTAWLARFSSLRRPLDGAMPLAEVLMAAGDVASGILTAKAAAQAARAASEAAEQARASAEKAQELSKLSQAHAEAAARDLLAAKKAEMQVLPLLTGGKNPDPAAAELLKVQAAAKCAEQLKACHTAATDAATQSEHAQNAAEAAAAAVLSAQKSVLDAAVSAEAQAQASKAAAEAEAAATAAADAANKAQAAKQLSDGYAQDAAKWAAAAEAPPDANIPSSTQPAQAVPAAPVSAAAGPPAPSRPATGRNSSASTAPGKAAAGPGPQPAAAAPYAPAVSSAASSTVSSVLDSVSLKSAGALPAPLAVSLHEEWCVLERAYVEGMGRGFAGLREAHSLAVNQVAANRSWFTALLQQPDNRQALLSEFVARFNSVELDMRKADATKGELLLRCEELRDALWALCDAKHDAVEAARLKLAADGSAAEQVSLMGARLASLVQVEVDRFTSTAQFLWSYCHNAHGVYHPAAAADKAIPHINVLAGADAAATGSKTEQAKVNSMGTAGPHIAALQQRLPQLAAALKTALTAAAAAETAALGLVIDAQQKSAAAAAHATNTANAAAAAAAAAAGQSTAGAAGHRQAASGSAKSSAGVAAPAASPANSKASAAAAAASSKLAASSEEAATAAAAAAAVAAAMPDQAELAAVHAELHAALGLEVALLQQRLTALTHRASVLTEEVVQLHGAINSQLAEWSHARYVAECGAVAALERMVRAAAASGKPLAQELKLEDEFLVVTDSQQLETPRPEASPSRPPSPPLPPVLSLEQLAAAAAAMQSAEHPAGFLAMQAAVDLMLSLASQGVLPGPWRDIDTSHMASALSVFDPTYSGYLDWRALLLALAAATFSPLHTATPAQLAAQALQLAAADGDKDGKLTRQEFDRLRWWFEPRAELQEAAAAAPEQHTSVLQQVDRCHKVTSLLWNIFKEPAVAGDNNSNTSPAGQQAASNTATPAVGPEGAQQAPNTASAAADPAPAPPVATAAIAATADGETVYVVPAEALLLYLCADRDLYAGISKAMSVVAQTAGAGAKVDAQGVLRMCYPLIQPAQATAVCRAPLSAQQVVAAVAAAAAAGTASQPAPAALPAAASTTGGKGGSGSGNAGSRKPSFPGGPPPAAADAASETVSSILTASQLMYSAPCERIVTLLLSKYQWQDLYVNALL